jgi:hypothetical protein
VVRSGIENIEKKARAPSQTEVRYFQESERSEAPEILQVLKDAKLTVKSEPQLIPGQKNVDPVTTKYGSRLEISYNFQEEDCAEICRQAGSDLNLTCFGWIA